MRAKARAVRHGSPPLSSPPSPPLPSPPPSKGDRPTSPLFQPYFSSTTALLHPYFSPTSALLQAYFSLTPTRLQSYFSLTSALTSTLLQLYFSPRVPAPMLSTRPCPRPRVDAVDPPMPTRRLFRPAPIDSSCRRVSEKLSRIRVEESEELPRRGRGSRCLRGGNLDGPEGAARPGTGRDDGLG